MSISGKAVINTAVRKHIVRMIYSGFFFPVTHTGQPVSHAVFFDVLPVKLSVQIKGFHRTDLKPTAFPVRFIFHLQYYLLSLKRLCL